MADPANLRRSTHTSSPPNPDPENSIVRTTHAAGGYQLPNNEERPGISFPDPGPQFVNKVKTDIEAVLGGGLID